MSQDEQPSVDIQPAIPPGIQLHLEAGNRRIHELGIDEELVRRTVDRAAARLDRDRSRFARFVAALGRPLPFLAAVAGALVALGGHRLFDTLRPSVDSNDFSVYPISLDNPLAAKWLDETRLLHAHSDLAWNSTQSGYIWGLDETGSTKLRAAVADCTRKDAAQDPRLCIVTTPNAFAFIDPRKCTVDGSCEIRMAIKSLDERMGSKAARE
jgi:hypothetical protein